MMTITSRSIFSFGLLLATTTSTARGQLHGDETIIRWTSTGGGWRSMFACMGYAYVFQQAGLLDDDHSHFTAISTNSGGSWWATQAFYSPEFYGQTTMALSAEDLKLFAIQWMNSYHEMAKDFEQHQICTDVIAGLQGLETTTDGNTDTDNNSNSTDASNSTDTTDTTTLDPLLQTFSEFCDMLVEYDGDWTAFMQDMFQAAANNYEDVELPSRVMDPENRIEPLKQTDLIVQSAILANSRIRASDMNDTSSQEDTTVFLGPTSQIDQEIYALTLSAAYTVNTTYNGFEYNNKDASNSNYDDLAIYQETMSPNLKFEDYEDFFLYEPPPEATPTIDRGAVISAPSTDKMRQPFGGPTKTNVVQIASISSAATGSFSPAAPSTFAQSLSKMRAAFEDDIVARTIFDKAADALYQSPMLDKFAVCSQWPEPCGLKDALFIDGGLVDNAAIPINIAQYHLSEGVDLDRTIKLVVTNNNDQQYNGWGSDRMNTQLLQYFNNSMNAGVEPGDFIWYEALPLPFRSPQIFEDYMDIETLDSMVVPLEGSSTMTTAFINVTTIANPAFGIMGGQKVEILLINLNSPITTFIVGKTIIEEVTEPMGEMVYDIASNQALIKQVKDFFQTHRDKKPTDPTGGNIPDEGLSNESAASTKATATTSVVAIWVSLLMTVTSFVLFC